MAKGLQCKDIPNEQFLGLVAAIQAKEGRWAYVGDVTEATGWPEKLVRAKARKLIDKELMDGCPCGCRGDFEVLPR